MSTLKETIKVFSAGQFTARVSDHPEGLNRIGIKGPALAYDPSTIHEPKLSKQDARDLIAVMNDALAQAVEFENA